MFVATIALATQGTVQAQVAAESVDTVVELTGRISTRTDSDGEKEYSIIVDGKAIRLDAGPHGFYGDAYPLESYPGKTVTVTGEHGSGRKPEQGRSAEKDKGSGLDVLSVTRDGKTAQIRSTGKPSWAGGRRRWASNTPAT
ncbi:MAG: hypothetical protein M3P51_06620 [Chloroflexota bacterium]|nr:hypothetical protein [Chloroflexota bacterium]